MLLKSRELEAIKAGTQSRVFRRWKRPTVRTGGSLKTAVGLLAIERVTEITPDAIAPKDAYQAGYSSRSALLEALDARDGRIYRIDVRFAGADPRIQLREDDRLSAKDCDEIIGKLERLDQASRVGPWTRVVIAAIAEAPKVAAATLAKRTGFEKDRLKTDVRKLKNLGLTISHQPGYELSPRGKKVWARYRKREG